MGLLPMSREGEGKDAYKRGHVQAAQAFRTIHFADYRGTPIAVVLRRDCPPAVARDGKRLDVHGTTRKRRLVGSGRGRLAAADLHGVREFFPSDQRRWRF